MIAEDIAVAASHADDLIHPAPAELHRALDWKDAFWASSGVPAGVLLTMGGIATVIGRLRIPSACRRRIDFIACARLVVAGSIPSVTSSSAHQKSREAAKASYTP